jgi:hypothetical protein
MSGKYGNKRTVIDNIAFASRAEARRYVELRLREQAGEIRGLEVHPTFPLCTLDARGASRPVARYVADFAYYENGPGHPSTDRYVVEDVKSPATSRLSMFRLKKRWMKLQYGIDIVEIDA